jgi:rhodanese-related sulfurtransferase
MLAGIKFSGFYFMLNFRFLLLLSVALTLFVGCDEPQQSDNKPAPSAPSAEEVAIDTTRFIRAADLLDRVENKTGHFVFDVRNKNSYAESHVRNALSMPYGQFEPQDVAGLDQMTLDKPIVTYCGCPHHLAGLAADQLIEWGYRDVRVLHEGFWYWRDNQFPLAGLQAQQTSELQFAGIIVSGDQPVVGTEVFIRNIRNDQLEAAATDANGKFETGFHVLDYRPDDQFEIRVGSLNAPVARRLSADFFFEREALPVFDIAHKG